MTLICKDILFYLIDISLLNKNFTFLSKLIICNKTLYEYFKNKIKNFSEEKIDEIKSKIITNYSAIQIHNIKILHGKFYEIIHDLKFNNDEKNIYI